MRLNLQTISHMATHLLIKCSQCSFETTISIVFRKHVKDHDNEVAKEEIYSGHDNGKVEEQTDGDQDKDRDVNEVHNESTVTCPFCKLESKNQEYLKLHIKNIHITGTKSLTSDKFNEIISQTSEICNQCPHCTFIGSNNVLENHILKSHGVAVICGECGNNFPDTRTCEDHIEAKHTISPNHEPFPCDECSLVLGNFNLYQSHKINYHPSINRQEPFPCDECKTELMDFTSLKDHKQAQHNQLKYTCNECKYGSNLYTELWKHKFMMHDISNEKNIEAGELFMNVIAAQQDFIIDRLDQSDKRWESELKDIKNNQNNIFEEIKALHDTVVNNHTTLLKSTKDALENITTKAESLMKENIQSTFLKCNTI